MAGARKSAVALAIFLASLAVSFGARDSLDLPCSAGCLLQGADIPTSSRPLVPINAAFDITEAATERYSSSSHHTELLTAHSEGAIPTATGATEPKGSPKTAEQRMAADSTTAGILQSPSSSDLTTRQLLAASAASSSPKAGPTPNNAEQMAQKGLQAEIAEALKGSGSLTKNAGDRH